MNINDHTFNPIAKHMLTTTLAEIKARSPDEDTWKRLLNGLGVTRANKKPLPLERILEICGLDEALWVLRAFKGHDNAIRLFACYCARYALHTFERKFPDDKRPREAIETAERFARGQATLEELNAAEEAAGDAASTACDAYTFGNICWFSEYGNAAEAAAVAASLDPAGAAFSVQLVANLAASVVSGEAAYNAAWDDFKREFIRLCRLEGEYGRTAEKDTP